MVVDTQTVSYFPRIKNFPRIWIYDDYARLLLIIGTTDITNALAYIFDVVGDNNDCRVNSGFRLWKMRAAGYKQDHANQP